MKGSALGIATGVFVFIFAFPVALFVGALSAGFHRGVEPSTFGLGISWVCRWVFYGCAGATVVGLLVVSLLIAGRMTLFFIWMAVAVAVAYRFVYTPARTSGGGVL